MVFLPLCHIFGRDVAITLPLISRLVPHYGETVDDLMQTMFEVAPTVLFTVPRYMQKFASQVLVGLSTTSPVKRAVYDAAMRLGRASARRRWAGRRGAATDVMNMRRAHHRVRPRAQQARSRQARACDFRRGAAAEGDRGALADLGRQPGGGLRPDRNRRRLHQRPAAGFLRSPAMSEPSSPGWQVRLDDDGQILVKGPDQFEGYWNQPDATRQIVDSDQWLHTGDVGEWQDGNLRLIDRARDFLVTAGGKTISPSGIESTLRASPYIGEAIVFGHGRKYLTALIEIDFDSVADWARANNVSYTGFTASFRARRCSA